MHVLLYLKHFITIYTTIDLSFLTFFDKNNVKSQMRGYIYYFI